ncbi:hypothetical protein SPRG_00003 [Saprolegnia parasitica CBS 223.65]|uniref:Tyrosine-protein kinase ephrin type A/B receptor-like domain-containing protein n=1 Tax=Saprolegnia parasitica (strain CBS 223.65) TaxID=695850 RepID=A0A067D830_SAPPC|nr:hypothetical protein SPRG_00003 [Saprolegnia parasitica CBS 223.65]KDO35157.1 hypothetical protein SPRG_00003 [Saprolegnia parasitica CBS 223.65]|eukprot:XP_012193509.1 hypothetical protein SPRG_00003 [Saprolegnia parasitica CBS 223.65]
MRRCCPWSRLALLLVLFAAWAPLEPAAATIIVGPSTSPDALRALFHCASRQWIGRYNELYQECVFANTSESLLIVNTTIDATALFVQDHGPFAVHIELGVQLNRTSGTLRLENATLFASAVFVDAANVSLDAASAINTTANGLRFGPGYSSYVPMGSAYGGLGGYTLSHASFAVPGSCDDIDRDGAYTKPIGDLFGHVMDFRGYGSGGSEADSTRGGGRISLNVSATLQLDGRLLADGGFDATFSTSSGAGGTVVVQASAVRGSGVIQAVGGQATAPDSSGRGGGGGGGGGRVFLHVATAPTIAVRAFGGRHASPVDDVFWCQEGGAGTILVATQRDKTTVDGQLVIKGRDGPPKPPRRLVVGTPLFYWTSRREHMLPPWLNSVVVAGQSLLIASTVLLERGAANTSILLEASAAWANAADNSTLHGSATNVTLHGYVGPLPVRAFERGRVVLTAGDLILVGAIVDAAQLELRADVGSVSTDDDCTLRFEDSVLMASAVDIDVRGAVELPPSRHHRGWRRAPSIVLESQRHTRVAWQPSLSLASVDVAVRAVNQSVLTIHGPLRRLRVDAGTIECTGGVNGSSTVFPHESRDICRPWPVDDDCASGDYQLALVATSSLAVADVHASSVLLCAPDVRVGGSGVGADGLGCKEDGPGISTELDGASGGAGHGGRGGNVEPGDRGGGATCDASWPGSGAAGDSTGGLGGGLVLLRATTLALDAGLSVRGGNGTAGGGGGAGGSLLLFLKELQGKGSLDVSGGAGSSTSERHGGGGGGGVVRIAYAPDGSGQKYLGTVDVAGGSSAGQTGYDGLMAGLNCVAGCGGVFCAPCAAGQASAVANGTCEPCARGTFSAQTGSTACTNCAPGSFNPTNGSTACFLCAKGQFAADAAATACTACPPGSMSPEKGAVHCTLCPIGSTASKAGSATCDLCDVGHTTRAVGSLACVRCDTKPYHATYNQNGTCHYMCEKGRVGLKCLTPFEQLVAPIGGPLGFVLLCLGSIGLIFAGYGMLSYRGPPASRRLKQYQAQLLRQNVLKHAQVRDDGRRCPHLSDHQLPFHVARIYFEGHNDAADPWHLSTALFVDSTLRKALYEGSFAAFAAKCNHLLRSQSYAMPLLDAICMLTLPILGHGLRRRYRQAAVRAVATYVDEYGAGFFRDLDVRRHGASLLLGFSDDLRLGYLDLLLSPDAQRHLELSPTPALVFALAGAGTFLHPWHLDTNDALLRSVPSRLQVLRDSGWLEFVAALNLALRIVLRRECPASLTPVQVLLARFNDQDDLNGYTVALGVFNLRESGKPSTYLESIRDVDSGLGPRDKIVLVLRPPRDSMSVVTAPASPPATDASMSMSSIRYAALYAPEPKAIALEEAVGLVDDAPPMTQPTWRQQLRRALDAIAPTHVAVSPGLLRYAWGRPVSFLALLVADFLLWFWLALQFFCIQVGDPTVHEAGCSHAALVLVLSVMPLAVLGAPLLGLAFVFGKRSSVGRLFVLWTATCYWNAATAFGCGVYYSAYVGDSVLGLSLVAACVKWLEARWALRLLAQFEGDRSSRGWAGLFTTRDYYDCADRPLGRWLAT